MSSVADSEDMSMFVFWSYVKAVVLRRRVYICTHGGQVYKTLRPKDISANDYRDEMKGLMARAHNMVKFGAGTNWVVLNTDDIESIEVY